MFPPEFFPVEFRGMSVITAGIFFFIGVGSVFMYNLFRRELTRINTKIESQAKVTTESTNKVDNLIRGD